MIYLYSGTPGSGKSLHMATQLYYWLKSGKHAIGNFEINTSMIKRCKGKFIYTDNLKLTPEFLKSYAVEYFKSHKFNEGALRVYIDECQLIFNAREWNIKGRSEWLSFFTQHRKYGYDVYLVAQFDRMIDRQIRSLIEYEIIHRKVSNFGIMGKILSAASMGKLFVAVKIWYPLKEKVGSEFFKAHKKYYRLYDSYKTFSTDDLSVSESNTAAAGSDDLRSSGADVKQQIKFKSILPILKSIIAKFRLFASKLKISLP